METKGIITPYLVRLGAAGLVHKLWQLVRGSGTLAAPPSLSRISFIKRYVNKLNDSESSIRLFVYHSAWIWFAYFVLLNAWVSEDAYITLRVLDNFFNGYGLRWNIHERVQVYTHPLWMLLHIPVDFVISNLFLSNVLLSVAGTVGAVLVTLSSVKKPLFITLACFYLPLMASKSFRDYSTSGLENPLSYLLFAVFGYILLKKYDHPKFWLYMSLTIALSLMNRLDMIVFYAPTLLWLLWNRFSDIRWKQAILGSLPLVAWLVFAIWYYGFIFPNTKYAKLDTSIESYRYIKHGLAYAKYTLIMDTATGLEILSSLVFIILALVRKPPILHPLYLLPACIALGLYWYVLYLIYIGGDYMVGRFWAYPAFVAVWLIYVFIPENISIKAVYGFIAVLLATGTPLPTSAELRKLCPTACTISPHPMIDAKWMFSGNFLFPKIKPLMVNTDAHHKFVGWAAPLAKKAPGHVEKAHFIGMLGYYAGPGNILVDELALGDPLLSRMPVIQDGGFFIGHFKRPIPKGYFEAIKTGSTAKMDRSLAQYYEKLRLITSGDLSDPKRLKTIIEFNLGYYDHFKRDYLYCNLW